MKNITIAVLIAIALITISSSCKKDLFDEKRNASLNIHPANQKTSSSGIFSVQKDISKKNITNVDYELDWEKIIEIWLRSSQVKIESDDLQPGYFIKLDISCSKITPGYSKTITVQSFNKTKSGIDINMSQDTEYASFMKQVFSELKSGKTLDFRVQGIVTDKLKSPVPDADLKITINNKLEIKVRPLGLD